MYAHKVGAYISGCGLSLSFSPLLSPLHLFISKAVWVKAKNGKLLRCCIMGMELRMEVLGGHKVNGKE